MSLSGSKLLSWALEKYNPCYLSEAAPLVGSSLDLGVFLEDEVYFLSGERSFNSPSSIVFTFSTSFSKSSIVASGISEAYKSIMAFSSTYSIYSIAENSASSLLIDFEGILSSIIGDNSTFETRATMSSI